MSEGPDGTSIVLIDRQDTWLKRSTSALEQAGFAVQPLNHYDDQQMERCLADRDASLVILSCARVGPDEKQLVSRIVEHNKRLMVLAARLPTQELRWLFLTGANDVADKPYDASRLVALVHGALQHEHGERT
jgi:DNA-binding response OmpR family regulator